MQVKIQTMHHDYIAPPSMDQSSASERLAMARDIVGLLAIVHLLHIIFILMERFL